MALSLEEAFRFDSGHATGAGGGDGLTVDVVLYIAGGKDARHRGLGGKALVAALGDKVAVFHGELAGEDFVGGTAEIFVVIQKSTKEDANGEPYPDRNQVKRYRAYSGSVKGLLKK